MSMNDDTEASPLRPDGDRYCERTYSAISGTMPETRQRLRSASFGAEPSRRARYDVTGTMDRLRFSMVGQRKTSEDPLSIGESSDADDSNRAPLDRFDDNRWAPRNGTRRCKWLSRALSQIPAVVLIGMFHLMIGIPFGVSYFPVGWRASAGEADDDNVSGAFPLPGKEALGIRMFLFSTIVAQVVFTLSSGFDNPIGLQMVENVPFCHELSLIVISHQGYGMDALSTLFVMFGMASIVVGAVFYVLGRLELGRVVYYFPTHVLVGCIGGIGVYIAKTGVEVTIDAVFSWSAICTNMNLLAVVCFFEVVLRVLEFATRNADGTPRYSLLSPIYFCMITPVFYTALWLFGFSLSNAEKNGYFFPSLLDACDDASQDCSISVLDSIFNKDLFEIWRIADFSTVSWPAILDSVPTLVALTLFSLIHVPINIPAFAISTNTEVDMNNELMAHGYSNVFAGIFGGLQNYMAYTQSVLYDKSGGKGKASGMAVAGVTTLLFFVGPTIASYIPRCMAGTLLLHVGIDLFLEGVYDSYGKFDNLEYAGIWLITIVMTVYGMDAAMIAGVIAAISTYVVQSMHYVNPVRGSMSASTLRSSRLSRSHEANAILDDHLIGRNRIFVIQLQGHLFFGNMAHLTQSINRLLSEKRGTIDEPWIVILDFSLVLGIDSSAAQSMAKLKNTMRKSFHVDICIFVTGSDDGFPCEFDLSKELSAPSITKTPHNDVEAGPIGSDEEAVLLHPLHSVAQYTNVTHKFEGSHVCDSLDLALMFSEDALIARKDLTLLEDDLCKRGEIARTNSSLAEEREIGLQYLINLCPGQFEMSDVELLFSHFEREVFTQDEVLWKQDSPSDCLKLLVQGTLIAVIENEAGTSETIECGNILGEVGLVMGVARMSSVQCTSEEAVLYNLSRGSFEQIVRSAPQAARLIDLICVRYLFSRVQHVSNRIFETRCLPI